MSGPEFAIATMPRALNCEWERMMSIGASDAKNSDYNGAPERVENGRKSDTFKVERISSAKGLPQIDWPPLPVPAGSPV